MTYEDAKRILYKHSIYLELNSEHSHDLYKRDSMQKLADAIRTVIDQAERNS